MPYDAIQVSSRLQTQRSAQKELALSALAALFRQGTRHLPVREVACQHTSPDVASDSHVMSRATECYRSCISLANILKILCGKHDEFKYVQASTTNNH